MKRFLQKALATLVAGAVLSAPAAADEVSTNIGETLKWCMAESTAKECYSYFSGVADVMRFNCSLGRHPAIAQTTSNRAIGQAFIDWANDNPQLWPRPMTSDVYVLFDRLFVCTAAK